MGTSISTPQEPKIELWEYSAQEPGTQSIYIIYSEYIYIIYSISMVDFVTLYIIYEYKNKTKVSNCNYQVVLHFRLSV